MDFPAIQQQLNDLPPTFKRKNASFLQLVDSLTFALANHGDAADATVAQLTFQAAQYGWLEMWGLLFGIPKNANEANQFYALRIAFEVLAGGGPAAQIAKWVQLVWNVAVVVTEQLPAAGYTLTFPAIVSTAQINAILQGLAYIRPAGVPILGVYVQSSGTILETINFFDAPDVIGGYLSGGLVAVPYTLASSTNNAVPLLPTLFLTDPTLNPPAP